METRDKIIKAAIELFVEEGFGTPTSAISKKAGVSSGILFHYFKTKEVLITSLFLEIKQSFLGYGFRVLTNDAEPNEGVFHDLWLDCLQWVLTHSSEFRFMEQYHHTPYMKVACESDGIIQYTDSFHCFLGKAGDVGVIKKMDPVFVSHISLKMISALMDYLLENPKMKDDKKFLEQAWKSYWAFLSA
jgi:AcrR family transcriptional regulator